MVKKKTSYIKSWVFIVLKADIYLNIFHKKGKFCILEFNLGPKPVLKSLFIIFFYR